MDFMHDQLDDGRGLRLNVIEDCSRDGLGTELDFSLPSTRVIRNLQRIIERRAKPESIRCDHGPDNSRGETLNWIDRRGIRINHIDPGKPQQTATIGRYNRTVGDDRPTQFMIDSIAEIRDFATD